MSSESHTHVAKDASFPMSHSMEKSVLYSVPGS